MMVKCEHEWIYDTFSFLPKVSWSGEGRGEPIKNVPTKHCLKCDEKRKVPKKELEAMAREADYCSECGKKFEEDD